MIQIAQSSGKNKKTMFVLLSTACWPHDKFALNMSSGIITIALMIITAFHVIHTKLMQCTKSIRTIRNCVTSNNLKWWFPMNLLAYIGYVRQFHCVWCHHICTLTWTTIIIGIRLDSMMRSAVHNLSLPFISHSQNLLQAYRNEYLMRIELSILFRFLDRKIYR